MTKDGSVTVSLTWLVGYIIWTPFGRDFVLWAKKIFVKFVLIMVKCLYDIYYLKLRSIIRTCRFYKNWIITLISSGEEFPAPGNYWEPLAGIFWKIRTNISRNYTESFWDLEFLKNTYLYGSILSTKHFRKEISRTFDIFKKPSTELKLFNNSMKYILLSLI